MEIKLGQVLYKPVYSRNSSPTIKELEVTKIGRTYLYVDNNTTPIQIKDLTHVDKVYSQCNFTLYQSEQEILDMWEEGKLHNTIQSYFQWGGKSKSLSLAQLKEINAIINP